MNNMTYIDLLNKTLELYLHEDYLKAYNFITNNAAKVKANMAQIYNFRYAIASKAGLYHLAMNIMREAIVDNGYWYSYEYLMEDDDLKPLKERKEFYELVNICKQREVEAKKCSKPDLKIKKPTKIIENKKYPVLIALHGNEENIFTTEDYWSRCISNNYLVAFPQSSEIGFSDGYYWNDVEKGSSELKEHYENILEENNIDLKNIIIGGFSAGARVALYSILNGIIKVKGLILVSPWLPEINEWNKLLDNFKDKDIKFFIVCGDKDEDCLECTEKLINMLNERDIPNIIKIIKGLDHNYPCDFHEKLGEAIKYLTDDKY